MMNLYGETDVSSEIRKGRLRWIGNVERISEERTVKEVFKNTPEGERSVGKPKKRWLVDVENDLKKMGVTGWRKIGKGRDARNLILKEARVIHGP